MGNVGALGANALVYFDHCGYGYTYEECTSASGLPCTYPLGSRKKSLPTSLPDNRKELVYSVENDLPQAVVFGKECCASFYQENEQTKVFEPPQKIDDGFGVFVAPTHGFTYETIFESEYMVVYDAATGRRLFKTELGAKEPALYRCSGTGATMSVDASSSPVEVTLGGSGADAVGCELFPDCPLGMTAGTDGGYATCMTEQSNFIMGIEDWVDEHLFGISTVQLRAWGGKGQTGKDDGDDGGAPGFALTVKRPNELPQAFYAYTGFQVESTVVSEASLLSLSGIVDFTDIPTDGGQIVLIAGGGGNGSEGEDALTTDPATGGASGTGRNGGLAIANANPSGPSVSKGGGGGSGVGREGGNKAGLGKGGDAGVNPDDGSKGTDGGDGMGGGHWNRDGSLIVPTSWDHGQGGRGNSGGGNGAGGFGGGGINGGGGGGGTWVTGNTVYDSGAPSGRPSSPSDNGVFEIAYLPDPSEICTLISDPRSAVRCIFTGTETPLDTNALVDEVALVAGLGDLPLDDVAVSIEAWGGAGGKGGTAINTSGLDLPPRKAVTVVWAATRARR